MRDWTKTEHTSQLIRDGNHSVADLMQIGKTMLGRRHVMPAVISSLVELMVEGTFPSGTYLVTVHQPVSTDDGDLEKALYGSFLPIPSQDKFPLPDENVYDPTKAPGAVIPVKGKKIVIHEGKKRIRLKVTSKGDRPIQVQVVLAYRAVQSILTNPPDWITLPLHRDEPAIRIRPSESLRLPFRCRGRNIGPI